MVVSCSGSGCSKAEAEQIRQACAAKSVHEVKVTMHDTDPSSGVRDFATVVRCPKT